MAPVPRNPRRIDDLHRDVLARILSHLDARQAVQTCVLSREWRDLWRGAYRLHASFYEFDAPGRDCEERNQQFQKFVNRLLMLRNPVRLEEFRLTYNIGRTDADLEADSAEASLWIHHALLCNAWSVEVISMDDRLELDHAGLTSESLTSLRFGNVSLFSGFFRQLQTGCQALECLILEDCSIEDTEISCQTLKFLSIGDGCFFDSHHQASISAPSLTHFGLFGHSYERTRIPLLKNMESLETADISLDKIEPVVQVDDICQFLKGLSGVTTLDFYYAATELEMTKNLQWCPTFHKLKFLTLGRWCLHADYYALIVFLQNSPNLVKLTLQLNKYGCGFVGELGKRSFTCKNLNIVEIICVERDAEVNCLEEFLLASGITLGQILIKH